MDAACSRPGPKIVRPAMERESKMTKFYVLFAALACAALAQTDGKPDFNGTYEWPKATSGEQCRCSATIFDRKLFAPLKPGGEAFYEPPTGDPRHDEPR